MAMMEVLHEYAWWFAIGLLVVCAYYLDRVARHVEAIRDILEEHTGD